MIKDARKTYLYKPQDLDNKPIKPRNICRNKPEQSEQQCGRQQFEIQSYEDLIKNFN